MHVGLVAVQNQWLERGVEKHPERGRIRPNCLFPFV